MKICASFWKQVSRDPLLCKKIVFNISLKTAQNMKLHCVTLISQVLNRIMSINKHFSLHKFANNILFRCYD